MPATVTQVVHQCQQAWTRQLEPEAIRRACHDLAYQWRQRVLDPVVTRPLFFVQILHGNTAGTPLRHLTQWAVTASASCQARMRLPLSVFQELLRAVSDRVPHEALGEGGWFGHRTLWVDGSSVARPDTPAWHDYVGPPGGQQPGCGFPVAHLMALFPAGTGMVLAVFAAPLRTHEMSQVVARHPALQPGDVLVADRGCCSDAQLALLVQGGVHVVCRVHQKLLVDCTPGRPHVSPMHAHRQGPPGKPRSRWRARLGAGDQRVAWLTPLDGPDGMDEAPFAQLSDDLTVRALRSQVQRNGCRVQTITVVTRLVHAELDSVAALSALSFARWGIETNLAPLKTTLGRDVLTGTTVDGVRKERIVFALIDNVGRLVMGQAARRQHVDSDRSSFIAAARWLAAARAHEPLPPLVVNPHRPDRDEPRVRKRRPKQYPLMQNARQQLRMSLANNRNTE
jgi:hypothetical protein